MDTHPGGVHFAANAGATAIFIPKGGLLEANSICSTGRKQFTRQKSKETRSVLFQDDFKTRLVQNAFLTDSRNAA